MAISNVFDKLKTTDFDIVLDGEALFLNDDGSIMNRQASNGLFNKMVKNTISTEELSRLTVVLFDAIDYNEYVTNKGVTPYFKRLELVQRYTTLLPEVLKEVQTETIDNIEEALDFYRLMLSQGEEGAMIRNINDVWEGKRSKKLLKMKAEILSELEITEIIEGTGKFKGFLGSFRCASADGKLEVNVGSGLTDKNRKDLYNIGMVGKIITVKHNGVIQNESGGNSLFLPIFIEVREDKDVADTIEKIKDGI